jgi:hypothetical protein
MPVNLASPGIRVREVDLTAGRVDPTSTSIGGLVAPFAQGPVDLPVVIGSEKDLLDTFGRPYSNDKHYEHWLTASSYLAYGGSLRVVRSDDDNLANAVGTGSSVKVNSIEDYELKQYDENTLDGRVVFAKNPGSWANGLRVAIIDSKADQIISVASTAGITEGAGVQQDAATFTSDNEIVGEGTVTPLTGTFKGIVTGVGEGEVYVKFISHVVNNVETTKDYQGIYRFRSESSLSLVNPGAGSTSVQVTRGALGYTAAGIATGANVDSFFLNSTSTLDTAGGAPLALNDTVIGISTTGIVAGNDKFLVIDDELISLQNATVGNGIITLENTTRRGVSGTTAAAHADGATVKVLTLNTSIATAGPESSSATIISLSATEDLTTKVNSGGFLNIGTEFVSVSALLAGGSLEIDPDAVTDWYDSQTLAISRETVGNTTTIRTLKWNSVADRPGTSEYAAERGSRFDEVHVVVIDGEGKITGNAGTILEKHLNLSKASDAVYSVGSPSYWRTYLKTNSAYIFGAGQPASIVASGFSSGYTPSTNINWDQEAETANGPVIFGSSGRVNLELTGGQNYDGGSLIDSTGALSPDLSKIVSGYNVFKNTENYSIDFLLMGSANYTKTQAASLASQIIGVAGVRKDALAFVSPYRGAFLTESGDGTTNTINDDETITDNVLSYYGSVPSSSYAILDSGYKYMYDRFANTFRYVPLNGDIAGLCARNDSDNFPWFSPAGTSRGAILNAVKLAYNPSQSQRDRLYSARVNPVIFSPGAGIVLFGDKTGLAKASAFDRINVRRLFIYLEDAISAAARDQLFEFNDEITRTNFVNIVEPFLRDVQAKRGIQDYVVICDETNNTAAVIDSNEFVADIYIKPARSINFIGLTFVATRSGVSFDEVIGNV